MPDAIEGRELTLFDGKSEMQRVSQVLEAFLRHSFNFLKYHGMTSYKECNTSFPAGKLAVKRVDSSLYISLAFLRHRNRRIIFVRCQSNE